MGYFRVGGICRECDVTLKSVNDIDQMFVLSSVSLNMVGDAPMYQRTGNVERPRDGHVSAPTWLKSVLLLNENKRFQEAKINEKSSVKSEHIYHI